MSTAGKVIKCRAAVAWEIKKPLVMEDVEVAPPKAHEVRIKILYTSLCHTDTIPVDEDPTGALLPCILGHESAGIVESVGEGVTSVKPGDHVIPVFLTHCGKCDLCKHPNTNLCRRTLGPKDLGVMEDGTTRFTCKGKPIYNFMGCSTFSEYTVVMDYAVSKVPDHAPLDKVCLIGCGVATGYGSSLISAGVTKGSTVAVWGLGGVGLAAVMGAKDAGAARIIGIDLNPKSFENARKVGATECINPRDIDGCFISYIREKFDGGFDFTLECTGRKEAMEQAYECVHDGWGVSCIVGVSNEDVKTNAYNFLYGRKWIGAFYGGFNGPKDIPMLVDKYLEGKIMLDEFITHHFDFEDINKAFDIMHAGKGCRSVMTMAQK